MTPTPSSEAATTSFQVILAALRHGDYDAWREVLERYSERLVSLARSRLFDARLRQKVDPEDVAQSVWRTFFRRARAGEFTLASWDALWGLLVKFTVFRVCKWDQHYNAAKRSLDLEVPLVPAEGRGPADRPSAAAAVADPLPTPLEVLQLVETVQEKLAALPEAKRRIIEGGLLGQDDAAIASQVGRTEARVRQVRDDFVQELLGVMEVEEKPEEDVPEATA
jgi:RNA polymerase sigma-70 factor (ECF subfamily)